MIKLKDNKKLLHVIGGLVVIFALALILIPGNATDDWQYTHRNTQSIDDTLVIGGIALGSAIILAWLGISIYLIIKGRRIAGVKNPKRKLGLSILLFPFGILAFSLLAFISPLILFAVLIAAIGVPILLIIYAVKKHVKIAIVPIICLFLVVGVVGLGGSTMMLRSGGSVGGSNMYTSSMPKALDSASLGATSETMGFSVGGAKDVDNFRVNIENNYTPAATDLTYEGLFYDYYFETGQTQECKELFCPSYNYAITEDQFSEEDIEYLSVGLNSNMKKSDFERKKLNVVVVIDISGSMGSSFNKYYYDQFNPGNTGEKGWDKRSKMEIANEAVVDLLGHLEDDDRFGMVLFESSAHVAKPLSLVGETDMQAIKGHIKDVKPRGGTNMESGYKAGTKLLEKYADTDSDEYENRIIFLTDAMPNTGMISEGGLFGLTKTNADKKIHTSFIGVGVDFNTQLIEEITKIRGANYYSVHNAEEFSTRMDDEFELMVTPLVFNLLLEIDAEGYDIEKVYGSPEANEATGEIMKVNTLFPSRTQDGETRGGIIVLKLKKTSEDAKLTLSASYEDRSGAVHDNEQAIKFPNKKAEYFSHNGLRKAVLLSRYADLTKNWMQETHKNYQQPQAIIMVVNNETGIPVPMPIELGQWERRSVPLLVTSEYAEAFDSFADYFEDEMDAIGDDSLEQELDVLRLLSVATN